MFITLLENNYRDKLKIYYRYYYLKYVKFCVEVCHRE